MALDDGATSLDQQRHFAELIEASRGIVLTATIDGVIEFCNDAARDALDGCVTAPVPWSRLFTDDALTVVREEVIPTLQAEGAWSGELSLCAAEGSDGGRTVLVEAVGHPDADGVVSRFSMLAHDITEYKDAAEILRTQATRDALTGLPNRAMLLEHLASSIARGRRTGLFPAVMFLDLDGFKAVNDGLGHEAGDELLIEVGRRLIECVRSTDIVARFGGDEFVILLDNVDDIALARQIADRIIARVEEPIELSSGTGNVGTSIGISLTSSDTMEAESLLGEADTAMYRAKQLGKRRHQFFDDELRKRAKARDGLRQQIGAAIDKKQFWVLYTPVASVATGELVAFEAGLRWVHPQRGILAPSEFMALAREAGVARDLDHFVIDSVATQAHDWNIDRDLPRTVWLTVGVHDLLSGDLKKVMDQTIERSGVAPGSLGIEIPLATLTKHPKESHAALQALNFFGVRIAIDDFGSDSFAPAQLQRYYADSVKLDRRMMKSLASDPEAVGALAAVSSVCRSLGLEVVAKGVKKVEELELLQELGATNVQGPIVSRPLRSPDVTTILEGVSPWTDDDAWPTREPLQEAMTRSQRAERMLRLRMAA